jgi:hypothetical protein
VKFIRSAMVTMIVLASLITVPPMKAQQQTELRISSSVLERYVGEWVYPNGNSVMLKLRDGTLYREIPGQQVPLVPMSETLFRLGPVFTAEFVMDNAGGITQILTDGAGVEYRLSRKGSPPAKPAASPVAVRVPRSVLERYVGVYEFIPGQMSRTDLRIVVRLEGDKLVRQMGQEEVLIPISETQFRVGNTSLRVEFVTDKDGGVTQVLGYGFQQLRARLTSSTPAAIRSGS